MEMVFQMDQSFSHNPNINSDSQNNFLKILYLNLSETIASAFRAINPVAVFSILWLVSFWPRNSKKSNEAKSSQ